MEQKRVSFKIAKAIKEAGYPQEYDGIICSFDMPYYNKEGEQFVPRVANKERFATCPTYTDVWFWLWREKKIRIHIKDFYGGLDVSESLSSYNSVNYSDPEEAIIAAIEYLVDNDLIK